jgi:hypothetical protein
LRKNVNVKTEIQVKNYRFIIGPQVGVAYTADGFSPYICFGLTYTLIRF